MSSLDSVPTPPAPGPARNWLGPRGRRIMRTGMWSLLAKAAAAANLVVAVPFVLQALGPVEFGAWATLVSLVVFAGFLDFGLGNGTMNLVAGAHGRGADDEIVSIVRESSRTLMAIAFCLALVALVVLPLVPWDRLLGLPTAMSASSRLAVAAVFFSIVLAVPLNMANRVQLGLGRGERAFRWQFAGQLLTLGLVIGLARVHAPFEVLTAAAVATPLLASVGNSILLWRDPAFTTQLSPRRRDIAKRIRHEGFLFFILQLAAAVAFSADLPLISALRGPSEAGTYAIAQRLFSIVPLGLGLVWTPLWPIYRQALAAKDHAWILRTLRQSIVLAILLAASGGTILAIGFDYISELWVHRSLPVSGILVAGFAVWCSLDAAGAAVSTFFNAASVMRYQVLIAGLFAIVCMAGKTWAIANYGITWVPWITAASYFLTFLLPTTILLPRLVKGVFARAY